MPYFPLLHWSLRSAKAIITVSGLAAFELPLAYIRKDKFNQPIFACNNLSGITAPAHFQLRYTFSTDMRCAKHI